MERLTGRLDAGASRIAIVVSRFNQIVTDRLLQGALDGLARSGVSEKQLTVAEVPGSFEIPFAAQALAQTGRYGGIVCLGALIRGETDHYEYLARQVTGGIGEVSLKYDLPTSYGLITAENEQQAINRAGLKHGNKGTDAALSLIEMMNLAAQVKK